MIVYNDLQIQADGPERLGCKRNLATHNHISLGGRPPRSNRHKNVISRQATWHRSTESAHCPGQSLVGVFPMRHRYARQRPGPTPGYHASRFHSRRTMWPQPYFATLQATLLPITPPPMMTTCTSRGSSFAHCLTIVQLLAPETASCSQSIDFSTALSSRRISLHSTSLIFPMRNVSTLVTFPG